MASYTVKAIKGEPRKWDNPKGGSILFYKLELEGIPELAEIGQKPETPAPTVGQTIEGDLSEPDPNYGTRKLKKSFGNGGFGGGKSPEQQKSIVRQHSQEMCLRYVAIQSQRGKVPEDFSIEQLRPIIEFFVEDAGR